MTRRSLSIAIGLSAAFSLLVVAAAPAQERAGQGAAGRGSGRRATTAPLAGPIATAPAPSTSASPAVRPRPEVAGRIQWAPSTGRDCHSFHGRRMCEGPRRVPLLAGESLARAERLGLIGNGVARAATAGAPPAAWVEAARAGGAQLAADLLWPVPEGRLWRGYGLRRGFRQTKRGLVRTRREHLHQGVDIGARQGSLIVAVNDGLVAYSDNRMRGYGNAVLLVHPDGSVSMYAHCVETYVVAGEIVRRGQAIAAVGQTGIAHGAHLHFEYRANGHTTDPFRMFTGIPERPAPEGATAAATEAEADDPSWEGSRSTTAEPPVATEHDDEP